MSTAHTAHNDHASRVAVRALTSPVPRPFSLVLFVTTILYRIASFQALRQPLRSSPSMKPEPVSVSESVVLCTLESKLSSRRVRYVST